MARPKVATGTPLGMYGCCEVLSEHSPQATQQAEIEECARNLAGIAGIAGGIAGILNEGRLQRAPSGAKDHLKSQGSSGRLHRQVRGQRARVLRGEGKDGRFMGRGHTQQGKTPRRLRVEAAKLRLR